MNVHVCGSLGLMFRVSPHFICEVGAFTKAGAFISCGPVSQPRLRFHDSTSQEWDWGDPHAHLAIPRVQDPSSGPHNCMGRALSAKNVPALRFY